MVEFSLIYGPSAAEKLNDWWKVNRAKWLKINTLDANDENPLFSETDFKGHFPARFLIFWEEESLDYQYLFQETPEIEPEILTLLDNALNIIKEKYFKPEDLNVKPSDYYHACGSTALDFSNESTEPEWSLEFDQPVEKERCLTGKRSLAPKRPGETREIIIATPGSRLTIRYLNTVLAKLVKRLPFSPYGKNRKDLEEILHIFSRRLYFYMRDISKCGLTLPHILIKRVFQIIYSDYPEFKNLGLDFFSNIRILNADLEWDRPTRGHGLGWFNEGTTILQYALNLVVCAYIGQKTPLYSALNDDQLAAFRDKEEADSYAAADIEICDKLHIPVSRSKTGVSENFYYLEEYYKDGEFITKDNQTSLAILGAKDAINICHAKAYVNCLIMTQDWPLKEPVKAALTEVITHWGYEFYPLEYTNPYFFGGWITPFSNSLDISLQCQQGLNGEREACYACLAHPSKGEIKLDKYPHLAFGREIGAQLIVEEPNLKIDWVGLFGNAESLKKHFSNTLNDWKGFFKFWSNAAKLRQERFKNTPEGYFPETDWYEHHPNSSLSLSEWEFDNRGNFKKLKNFCTDPNTAQMEYAIRAGNIKVRASDCPVWDAELAKVVSTQYSYLPFCDEADSETLNLSEEALEVATLQSNKTPIFRKNKKGVIIKGIKLSRKYGVPISITHYISSRCENEEEAEQLLVELYNSCSKAPVVPSVEKLGGETEQFTYAGLLATEEFAWFREWLSNIKVEATCPIKTEIKVPDEKIPDNDILVNETDVEKKEEPPPSVEPPSWEELQQSHNYTETADIFNAPASEEQPPEDDEPFDAWGALGDT